MSIHEVNNSNEIINPINQALNAVGTQRFPLEWSAALNHFIHFDHVSILHYSRARGSRIILAYGSYPDETSDSIASEYERECSRDPYFRRMMTTPPSQEGHTIHLPIANFSDTEYVEYFYNRINIVDKCSIIYSVGRDRILASFYRLKPSNLFTEQDMSILETMGPTFNNIILIHFRLTGELPHLAVEGITESDISDVIHTTVARQGSVFQQLSQRERDICELMLLGYRAADIAKELNIAESSVVTYRKRAYAKLGISSQKELFHMCLKK